MATDQAHVTELQALITGMVCGMLLREDCPVAVNVQMHTDPDGNYLPWISVEGRHSGERLRVSVEPETHG